ncbi:DUF4037 domain-containing protein [Streptomyces triticagri]|uniref:DUF4037 domain-containing protein n=1 Tax=Streptomyces triticagri TaxID=2293568 RepID=A0A372M5M4_9ACTN|nr:DUF4037 domain-containing protein [Streptomyces triticagri]RFU85825.1 DUF4037 domain-containing protein [Streptomyces triticagri]
MPAPTASSPFTPGLELSRRFYREAVLPLVEAEVPGVVHCAARLGGGSEVLGFDTPRSADHEWGPRLQLFLSAPDLDRHGARIDNALAEGLPKTFHGHPTHFATTGDGEIGVMAETDGPVRHRVEISTPGRWFIEQLGFDPVAGPTTADWLSTPTQRLAEVTSGAVFHDGLGTVSSARAALARYPRDVWLYVLACQWQRISQEEAFVGRCGEVGDELGSAVVAARLVRDLMRLGILMDRHHPPYSKWLGSAFARTAVASELTGHLTATLAATTHEVREQQLARAYETIAVAHNRLGVTDPVDPHTRPYHSRPYRVLHAERFAAALVSRIEDPAVRALPPTGAVDQFVDSTDILAHPERARAVVNALRTSGS